jgi:NAD(P)-dependent dehydrogenase (short-subunit alcohol dehydrogenase family)
VQGEKEVNMGKKFDGRVALVTGAASGIGRVGAQIFAREGAKVVVSTDSNIKGCEETVRLIEEAGGESTFVRCDVSKASDVEAMVDTCVKKYGRLDYAFNNAGVGPDGKRLPVVPIVECPEEVWDRTIDVNLKGVWLCLKYEIRQMLTQSYGVIVNTSSVGGLKPPPGFCAYAASKSGLHGLTKVAALEYARNGIRVNAILPGPTESTLLMKYLRDSDPVEVDRLNRQIPMGRLATPEDMAEAVIWLCSDAASFITGLIMPVDGGLAST